MGKVVDTTTARAVSHRELEGVENADAVVVLLPGGKGTHVELGIAAACRKPVLLFYEDRDLLLRKGRFCAFYYLSIVEHVRTEKALLSRLKELDS